MLKRKEKKVTVPAVETKQVTVPTLHGIKQAVVPAVTGAATAAKHWGEEHAHQAEEWARPRLEHGKEVAGTQLASAGTAAAGTATAARDRLEQGAPKVRDNLQAKLSSATEEAKESGNEARKKARSSSTAEKAKKSGKEARKQARHAAKDLKKKTPRAQRKRRGILANVLIALGVLAVAGAIAAYVTKKQSEPKDDPWARPLTDPYTAPATPETTAQAGTTDTGAKAGAPTVGAAAGAAAIGDQAGETDLSVGATTTNTYQPASGVVTEETGDATPPASLREGEVVDLTADGLPPGGEVEAHDTTESTLGDAIDEDKGRR